MSWIDDYVAYTSDQESPPIFHKWCGVSIIASVLNRRVWLDRRSPTGVVYFTNYPGQMSICLVAGAGRCKKSTAVSIAKGFMKEAGVALFDGKITPERLLTKLGNMPGGKPILTLVASELSSFMGKQSYNDGLVDNLNKLLDCESNPYETQKLRIILTDPCFTMLTATTPVNLSTAIPPQAQGHGYLSRHIHVYSERPGASQSLTANESDIDHNVLRRAKSRYTELVYYLRKLQQFNGPIKWSRPAQLWYNDYYDNYKNSPASDYEGYPQRRPDHLARLAIILQLASRPDLVLGEPALIEADQWLTEAEADLGKALAYIGQHANSEQTERIIKVFRETEATGKQLVGGQELWFKTMRYFGGDQDLWLKQMKGLIESGVLMFAGRKGDPKTGEKMYKKMREPY